MWATLILGSTFFYAVAPIYRDQAACEKAMPALVAALPPPARHETTMVYCVNLGSQVDFPGHQRRKL